MISSDLQSLIDHENAQWSQAFKKELDQPSERLFSSYWWEQYYTEMMDYMRARLEPLDDPYVLEVGAGSGKASILLGANVRRELLDISEVALEFARHLVEKFHVQRVSLRQGNAFDMPYEDKSFDVVWNIGVLEHYDEDRAVDMLVEMMRVACQGGIVAFGVPNFFSGPIIKARMLKWRCFQWLPGYRLDTEHAYSTRDLRRMVHKAAQMSGRSVRNMHVIYFGNPLLMESPAWILKHVGAYLGKMIPVVKFLRFVDVTLQ